MRTTRSRFNTAVRWCWVPLVLGPVDDVEASSRDVVMDLLKLLFVKSACSVVSIRLRNNSHAPDRAVNRSFLVVLIYAYGQLYLAMIRRALFEVLCTTVCTTSSRIISFGYYCISSEFVHLRTFIHNCNCDTVSNHPACGQMYCTVFNHQVCGLRYVYIVSIIRYSL